MARHAYASNHLTHPIQFVRFHFPIHHYSLRPNTLSSKSGLSSASRPRSALRETNRRYWPNFFGFLYSHYCSFRIQPLCNQGHQELVSCTSLTSNPELLHFLPVEHQPIFHSPHAHNISAQMVGTMDDCGFCDSFAALLPRSIENGYYSLQ